MNSNLNLAKEAAREAGSIIMKYYKKDYYESGDLVPQGQIERNGG